MATKSFKELIVWQKAHQFVLGVYKYSNRFPKEEVYSLTSQFRRAAISIAANIAEGYKKKGNSDKVRYMNIAQGSLEECQYYLVLSEDLGYGNTESLPALLDEIAKMLEVYMGKIEGRRS